MSDNKIIKSLEVECKSGELIQQILSDEFLMVTPPRWVAKDDGKITLTDRNIHAYLTGGWSESVNMPLRAFRTLFPNG